MGVDVGTIISDLRAILAEMKPCEKCGKLATPACCSGAVDAPRVDVSMPPGGWAARGKRPKDVSNGHQQPSVSTHENIPLEEVCDEPGIAGFDAGTEGIPRGGDTDARPDPGTAG